MPINLLYDYFFISFIHYVRPEVATTFERTTLAYDVVYFPKYLFLPGQLAEKALNFDFCSSLITNKTLILLAKYDDEIAKINPYI